MDIIKRIIIIIFLLILLCPATSKAGDNIPSVVYNENILVDCGCIVVDNSGNIYLVNGLFGTIQVYNQQGMYLYSIPVNTSGSFTISIDNDYLYVAVARRDIVFTYDKEGNLIDERPDEDLSAFQRFREKNSIRFVSSNGDVYSVLSFFGYITVSKKSGDTVMKIYSMPISHWIIKFLVSIAFILFIGFFVPVLLFRNIRKKKYKESGGKLRFVDFYLYIKKIKKHFEYAENGMAKKEAVRHIITKGFLLIAITLNLNGIFSAGYSDVANELITSSIYILTLFFILDIEILLIRFLLNDFVHISQLKDLA